MGGGGRRPPVGEDVGGGRAVEREDRVAHRAVEPCVHGPCVRFGNAPPAHRCGGVPRVLRRHRQGMGHERLARLWGLPGLGEVVPDVGGVVDAGHVLHPAAQRYGSRGGDACTQQCAPVVADEVDGPVHLFQGIGQPAEVELLVAVVPLGSGVPKPGRDRAMLSRPSRGRSSSQTSEGDKSQLALIYAITPEAHRGLTGQNSLQRGGESAVEARQRGRPREFRRG